MPRRVTPKHAAMKVFRAMEEASEASEGRMGFSFIVEDWKIGQNALHMQHNPLARSRFEATLVSELSSDRRRLEYIIRLCRALTKSASELLAIHERVMKPITLELSRGLAALPDELLGLIFKFATLDELEGTRHAVWLSQVSQRFRRIALEDRSLWSTQFQCYDYLKLGDMDRCISRCGLDTDFHIIGNCDDDFDFSSVKSFIDNCSVYASRWKSLTLVGDWEERKDREKSTIGNTLSDLMKDNNLDLPRLDELCLVERRRSGAGELSWYTPDNEIEFDEEVLWRTPNLRVLRCIQYIPPTSLPFESITKLVLSLTFINESVIEQIYLLHAFLLGRPNLLEIDLDLINSISDDEMGGEITTNVVVPLTNLKSFRLSLSCFDPTHGVRWLPVPFLRSLQMPNLENYELSTDLFELPVNLLPDPAVHPRIATFAIDTSRPNRKTAPLWQRFNDRTEVIDIPLDRLARVSSLSVLTTLSKISFSRGSTNIDLDRSASLEGSRLRELCLRSCGEIGIDGLRHMVFSLKGAGAWDGLDRIAIRACGLLEYDAVAEVVGKEKLYFSAS